MRGALVGAAAIAVLIALVFGVVYFADEWEPGASGGTSRYHLQSVVQESEELVKAGGKGWPKSEASWREMMRGSAYDSLRTLDELGTVDYHLSDTGAVVEFRQTVTRTRFWGLQSDRWEVFMRCEPGHRMVQTYWSRILYVDRKRRQ